MKENNQVHPDDLLLWYVNHTLEPPQRRDVDAHLEQCTRCRKEVTLLQKLRTQIKATPANPPGDLALQRLLHQVRQEKVGGNLRRWPETFWWRPAIAWAASLIIVVQSGLLVWTWLPPDPITTLSRPGPVGVVLQVTFVPSTTEANLRESIQAINGTIIGGPGTLGVYRIRLELTPEAHEEIGQAIRSLRSREGVVTHVIRE